MITLFGEQEEGSSSEDAHVQDSQFLGHSNEEGSKASSVTVDIPPEEDHTQGAPKAAQEESWTWESLLESIPLGQGNASRTLPPSSFSLWTHRDTIFSLESASDAPIWGSSHQDLQDLFDDHCKEWHDQTSAETCPEPSFQSMHAISYN